MTSPELMRELGAYLLGKHNYLKVDVHNPQFKVIVEIRDYGAYIHGPKVPGEGGLPVGTSGRALNMLSGGIDSPVAAYRMAKRGLALDHIHFASPPYTSERAKLKVKALAQLTSIYTGSSNLFVVPYTKPQEYIRDNAPDVLFTVLMRRSMMRIANVIAKRQGCEALVTGESLAQVASQTVKALQCTDAAQDLPILRPLIGMDKTEIVETARHINTFETSILPYEDCCTIFTPPHPKIRPELEEILEAEAAMPGLAALEAERRERRAHPHPHHRSGRIRVDLSMTAEIISVGTELLLGNILNTNAQYLSRELAALGITVQRESTIGDNHSRLADFVNEAKQRCDLLVFTGGLGPTADDLTKETVASCYGDTLAFDAEEWDKIVAYFTRTGRTVTPNNRKQAMVPVKGHKVVNRHGTAPGAWFEQDGRCAVLMPVCPRR